MVDLTGSVVIVSGGARGMGADEVRALAEAGARVVSGDVLDDEGKAFAAEVGDAVRYVHLDVTRAEDWGTAVRTAEDEFGPVTGLVNNAGIVTWGGVQTLTEAEWHRTIDVNLTGVFLGMQAVVPSMRGAGGGSIANISSTAGLMGYSGIAAYVASKWGVRGLTKAAAIELGPLGIRVNSIHPGPIRTPMTAGMDDAMAATQPIPRFGEPAEVTAAVLFLLGEATYCTGAELAVDGGAVVGQVLQTPDEG